MCKHKEELFRRLNELETADAAMTRPELDRLETAVLARVNKAAPRPARRRPRWGVAAAAVALVGVFSCTAFAVGPALLRMLQGKVGFFEQAPAASGVDNALDAPRGSYDALRTGVEAYNAPVGQSVTSGGVTITLDNLSMDAAGMDAFFTVTGERAVKGQLDPDSYEPDWIQLWYAKPNFWRVTVDGKEIAQKDASDFYRVDDNTLKLWCHYLLAETPQGESVRVKLTETNAMNVEGAWSFDVTLDGASVRAGGKTVEPGTYPTGGEPLVLERLAFGPVGGVIGAHVDETPLSGDAFPEYDRQGLDAGQLYIVDDTGRELTLTKEQSAGFTVGKTTCYNLTAPDPAATSLTVTPVLWEDSGAASELRTVTTGQLRAGVKLATTPLGGYVVRNFKLAGGTVTMELEPYGWTNGLCPEIWPEEEELISRVPSTATVVGGPEDGQQVTAWHSALNSSSFDPQVGTFTLRLDYYAATEEELAQITTWHYLYKPGCYLDESHAVTLPLHPIA